MINIYKIKIIFICLIVISNCSSFIQEKIPEYLAIVTDPNRSRPLVYEFILRAMNILVHDNLDDPYIVEDYLSIMLNNTLNWKEPDSWHTTCLYIGDNIGKLHSHIYENFKEGIDIELNSSTFVYVPKKLIIAPLQLRNYDLIENKFPHITLMIGGYRSVDSNYVQNSIFGENGKLENLFKDGSIYNKKFKLSVKLENILVKFEDIEKQEVVERIYLLKFGHELNLNGKTAKIYN